jgi:hypothetical protein
VTELGPDRVHHAPRPRPPGLFWGACLLRGPRGAREPGVPGKDAARGLAAALLAPRLVVQVGRRGGAQARWDGRARWLLAVPGGGRTFGAWCFAGELRSPAGPGLDQPFRQDPTLIPTRATRVPPRRLDGGSPLVMPPRGASRPHKPRPTGPPQGERSGQAERMRFARLIQRPVRVLGGPAVRAAFGGNLSLSCLPPRVRGSGKANGGRVLHPQLTIQQSVAELHRCAG